MGQFGEQIDDSPYILEKIFHEEQGGNQVDIQKFLVIAGSKLFFKRSPEMYPILVRMYKYVLKQSTDADLRQRVMFYYRLLNQDIKLAEKIICSTMTMHSQDYTQFFEDLQSEKRERLFLEFNTLSIVYGRPSEKFLKDKALKYSLASEKKYYPKERGFKNVENQEKLLEGADQPNNADTGAIDLLDLGGDSNPVPSSNTGGGGGDLLDLDFGGGSSSV